MKGILKTTWVWYTKKLGRTVFHPQYITNSYQYTAIIEAKKRCKKTLRLVDIGCGRMPYRIEIEPLISQYVGVDHPTISKLYKNTYAPEILADAHNLPLSNNSFDIALMLQMIEYLDEPQKAIQECYRVLKRKGTMIATIPFFYAIHDTPYDRGRYTKSMLSQWLKAAGFSKVTIISQGGFIESWFQMLTVWLFKTMEHLLSKNTSVISKLALIVLIVITPPFVFISNSIVFVYRQFFPDQKWDSEYFPLNYLVIAVK